MARTNTDKLKLPKHDTGDLNWGGDFNEGLDALDEHAQRETLRPPRTLTAQLGSGAVGSYLLGNTTYFYKVTAINSVGESTEGKIPAVVEASVTEGATPVPVLLEWEAVAGATSYRIYKGTANGGEEFLIEKTGGSTVTHTDDGNTPVSGGQNVPATNTARASVTGIRKTGEANPLRGDVKLKPGSGVTLTQLPGTNEIEIASPADVLTHALGGAAHTADTLANLNAKISDATLVDQAALILQSLADAKGDLIAASGADAWARVSVGADGEVLTADAASPAGIKWAAAAGGGGGYATVVVDAPTGNAATDTANIQAALDSLGTNGGTVVLREGVYSTNASLSVKPGTRIKGQGMHGQGTVTSRGTRINIGSLQYAFAFADLANPRDMQFEDFTIESSFSSGGATTLNDVGVTSTVRDIWFKRIRFYNHNANFNTNSGESWDRCHWIGCHFDRGDRTVTFGRLAANSSHFEIRGNKFYSQEIGLYGGNGTPGLGGYHVFADNIIECPLSASTPSMTVQSFFCAITGNVWRITGAQTSGTVLKISQRGHTVTGNNIIHSTSGPWSIQLFSGADECVVVGNRGDKLELQTGAANNYIDGNRMDITDNSGETTNRIGSVPESLADAKGDLVAATGANAFSRVPVGSDGQVLTADSAESSGVKWAAAAGGGGGGYATAVVDAPTGDAATDTAAVNAAISALPTAGGKILFREGTYSLNTLTAPATKPCWWQGMGRQTILAFTGATGWNMVDTPDQWFTDMKITLSGANSAVWNGSGTGVTKTNCRFERLEIEHNITATDGWTWWMQGIWNDIAIKDCKITCTKSQASGSVIGASAQLLRFIFQGNNIIMSQPSLGDGVITSFNGPYRHFSISDNIVDCGLAAYFIHFDNWCHHGVVSGNKIYKTGDPGATQAEVFRLDANPIEDVAFAGNEIHINSATADKSIAFGQISGIVRRCSFTGNCVHAENNAAGMIVSGSGLEFSENVVTGNRLVKATLNANASSTANVIVGNRATVTDNSGGTNTVGNNG